MISFKHNILCRYDECERVSLMNFIYIIINYIACKICITEVQEYMFLGHPTLEMSYSDCMVPIDVMYR